MRAWRYGKADEVKGYSLVEYLLGSLLNRREHYPYDDYKLLSPEDRLFIALTVDQKQSASSLAQLSLDCRCYAEASDGSQETPPSQAHRHALVNGRPRSRRKTPSRRNFRSAVLPVEP